MTEPALAGVARPVAPVLAGFGLSVRFGGIAALSDVSVEVAPRSVTGLVGPNGAGKSTAFAVLSGLLRPNAGRVQLAGVDVTKASPQARARRGLARTFQQPELFVELTVREHLVLADRVRHARPPGCGATCSTRRPLRRAPGGEDERVDHLLELLALTGVRDRIAASSAPGDEPARRDRARARHRAGGRSCSTSRSRA